MLPSLRLAQEQSTVQTSRTVKTQRLTSCTVRGRTYESRQLNSRGERMPVRDFVDSTGVEWRAWEVTPDAIYPPTRGEDYLADCYQLGWVVMETKRGDRRVRLCPIPQNWQSLPDDALERLLPHGEVMPARTTNARSGMADMAAVRTFRYPG